MLPSISQNITRVAQQLSGAIVAFYFSCEVFLALKGFSLRSNA